MTMKVLMPGSSLAKGHPLYSFHNNASLARVTIRSLSSLADGHTSNSFHNDVDSCSIAM
ncbi:hypothetical protein CHS0354_011802, partial [Potamilus streckersoni]